jgi:hypothetical protein
MLSHPSLLQPRPRPSYSSRRCFAGRNVGDILISTNPFKDLADLYSDRTRLLCVLP